MVIQIKNFVIIIIISIGYYYFLTEYKVLKNYKIKSLEMEIIKDINQDVIEFEENETKKEIYKKNNTEAPIKLNRSEVLVAKGDTFLSILKDFNSTDDKNFTIINKINKYYDLKKLKVNDKIIIYTDPKIRQIKKIEISIDFDVVLEIQIDDIVVIKKKQLEKESYQNSFEYKIEESLYGDGLKNNLPQDILIKLIKLFSFDLDFQRDIKKNTIVSVSYEFDRINYNNKIEYKDITYALIKIDKKNLEYFRFITDDGFVDYFNRDGKNVKKSILKTPLDGARLSSSFGMRKHPISGYNKMHKGVDFAAPKGTPIYAGGNGVIEYVGINGGYGKYIRIRHNNDYKTAYAHLSGFKKGISKGIRIKQGDIIGFVGSTGNSTGPHLHYEIIFRGKQINPMKLKLPSGKVLKGDELERFNTEYKKIYANHLNLLFE